MTFSKDSVAITDVEGDLVKGFRKSQINVGKKVEISDESEDDNGEEDQGNNIDEVN